MRRRGSLFAPLLLIGLGLLFLARNIYPDLRLIDYLAKYWPFLLIIWGVLRLGEILYWSSTGQSLPDKGVSGGEWTLVILLVFFGVSLHTVLGFYSWFPPGRLARGGLDVFGESYDYPLNGTRAAAKNGRVVIQSFSGNLRISGADTDQVKVAGHKTVRSLDQSGADRANQESPFELAGDPARITIQTNQNRVSGARSVTEDMELTVPKGASIEVHGVSRGRAGDFDFHDIEGAIQIDSENNGEVRLENIGGDTRLNLSTSNLVRAVNCKGSLDVRGRGGDLDLENIDGTVSITGQYSGMMEFHNLSKPVHFQGPQTEFYAASIPGQVRMPLNDFNATQLNGPSRLKTRFRDVEISEFTGPIEVSTDRGDIVLRPDSASLAKIDAHAGFGNITLALPPAAKFDINASTGMGQITNDFGGPLTPERNGRTASSLHGSNGGPMVTLHADRGNITLRRAGANEPPLAPRGPAEREPGKRLKAFPREPITTIDQ